MEFYSSDWKLLSKPAIFILGVSPKNAHEFPMMADSSGYTVAFMVLIYFCISTILFMTEMILYFPWWLYLVVSLGGTLTPSIINNSLT